jgi:hypothetical protein
MPEALSSPVQELRAGHGHAAAPFPERWMAIAGVMKCCGRLLGRFRDTGATRCVASMGAFVVELPIKPMDGATTFSRSVRKSAGSSETSW